jgi:hypothetical protein
MFIQPISRLTEAEAMEIFFLIPARRTPADKRRDINQYIRTRLAEVGNLAVALLAVKEGHQLSLKELRKRLTERRFTFRELFCLGEMLCCQTHYQRAGNRLMRNALKEMARLAAEVSFDDALAMILAYRNSRLQHFHRVINLVLANRHDKVELCRALG